MDSSSTKKECLRSALFAFKDVGVICSATHCGLRVRRSKADVVERVGWRSEIGPGKPYWKRPLGSTGGMMSLKRAGYAGTDVVGVDAVTAGRGFFSDRLEKIAAVAAAPVAADTPAIIAKVVFDMVTSSKQERLLMKARRAKALIKRPWAREM